MATGDIKKPPVGAPPAKNPGTTTTPTTTAPASTAFTRLQFIKDVLKGLGISKPSSGQIAGLLAWAASEGTHAGFNPFAIDGAYAAVFGGAKPPGATAFNSNGGNPVWNFRDYNQGLAATIKVIQDRFPGIEGAIQGGDAGGIIGAINASGWGSHPSLGMGAGTEKMGLGSGTGFFATGYSGDPGKATAGGGGGGASFYPGTNIPIPGTGAGTTVQDYLGQMMDAGITLSPAVHAFAQYAHDNQLTGSAFNYAMYHTPWFQAEFPGIFDASGRLTMSPTQYNATYKQYQGIASQYGKNLDRHQFGYALKQNVDSTTFGNRMQAIQFVESNPEDFKQFAEVLKARGLTPRGGLTKKDMFNVAMGTAPPAWNKVWEEGYLRGTAANAGLIVGRDIHRKLITQIIQQHPELYNTIQQGGSDAIQQKWYKLAQDLKTTAPASRLYTEGISTADLSQLEFGGPQAAEIAQRAQQALDNMKAAGNQQAGTELGALATRAGQGSTSAALASGVKQPFPTP